MKIPSKRRSSGGIFQFERMYVRGSDPINFRELFPGRDGAFDHRIVDAVGDAYIAREAEAVARDADDVELLRGGGEVRGAAIRCLHTHVEGAH